MIIKFMKFNLNTYKLNSNNEKYSKRKHSKNRKGEYDI